MLGVSHIHNSVSKFCLGQGVPADGRLGRSGPHARVQSQGAGTGTGTITCGCLNILDWIGRSVDPGRPGEVEPPHPEGNLGGRRVKGGVITFLLAHVQTKG